MPLTFADLLRLRTRDELRDALLTELSTRGFPVTSWALGGVARTLVEGVAQGTADLWLAVTSIARGMLLDRAEGDWLTELAHSHYDVARIEATYAEGYVRLTAVSGAGPYNLAPAAVVVSDGARLFRATNTTTLVLPSGGHVDVPVRAEVAGVAGNQPTLSRLVSPALAGVDATSPAYGGGSTWRTRDGVDRETDTALRQRCRDRWATLSSGFPQAAVRYWCLSARLPDGSSAGCTRVGFGDIDGVGGYVVYVASASGGLAPEGVTAVQAELDRRKPITDKPSVVSATPVTVAVSGSVRFFDGFNTGANRIAVDTAIAGYVHALPIGSATEPPIVDEAGIKAAIYGAVPGRARDVDLTNADVTVGAGQVAVVNTAGVAWLP